jgi:hypothetical protein
LKFEGQELLRIGSLKLCNRAVALVGNYIFEAQGRGPMLGSVAGGAAGSGEPEIAVAVLDNLHDLIVGQAVVLGQLLKYAPIKAGDAAAQRTEP